MSYKAYIQADILGRFARLYVTRIPVHGYRDVLKPDGTWQAVPENESPHDDLGIVVPGEALEAIAQALAEHLGSALPSQAHVDVLREWLAAEKERTDDLLYAARTILEQQDGAA